MGSDEHPGLLVGPADGQAIPNPIGGRIVVKVREADTHGAHSVHDNILPPG